MSPEQTELVINLLTRIAEALEAIARTYTPSEE